MIKKRFTMADGEYNTPICYDNGKELSYIDVVECLNNLHEENIALKRTDTICDLETEIMQLKKENQELKQELFEARKECLWATSDEVDRALYYKDEIEELRKEIFK